MLLPQRVCSLPFAFTTEGVQWGCQAFHDTLPFSYDIEGEVGTAVLFKIFFLSLYISDTVYGVYWGRLALRPP